MFLPPEPPLLAFQSISAQAAVFRQELWHCVSIVLSWSYVGLEALGRIRLPLEWCQGFELTM